MITSPYMSLSIWNQGTDYYSNAQLAANFLAIDSHNHAPGAGVLIGSNGIASNAIVWSLINPGAVQGSAGANGSNIYAGSITSTEIAAGTIGANQLAPGALSAVLPIGSIVSWFRPNTGIAVPANWHFADGTALGPGQHNFPGGGTVTLPNLINRFVLGCQPGTVGDNGPTLPPGEVAVGGNNAQNLSHTHSIGAHTHSVSHTHTIGSHAHSISTDGSHTHTYEGGNLVHSVNSRLPASVTVQAFGNPAVGYQDNFQCLYIANYNTNGSDVAAIEDAAGSHNHSGSTGGSGTLTSSDVSNNTTGAVALDTNAPDQVLPSDLRPNWIGLIYLIKIS